jgi:predicted glycoside hydrolase/deacetylase ChbG (UPF0249 family)
MAVDEGILDLVRLGRLTAVSCMAGGSSVVQNLPRRLQAASAAPRAVQIGLHVTLTQYIALGPIAGIAPDRSLPTLGALAARCQSRRADVPSLKAEIDRQMARLTELLGRRPDFLDGHQHVHLLPGIRDAVVSCWQGWADPPVWIRRCAVPRGDLLRLPTASVKSWVLSLMSQAAASRYAGIDAVANPGFYGVTGFDPAVPFAPQMRQWLTLAASGSEGGLIMCHPGRAFAPGPNDPADPIHLHRPIELAYLASNAFLMDLAATGAAPRFGA